METMTWEEAHIELLESWVEKNKFKELEDWCTGSMYLTKDNFEDQLYSYVQDELEYLWSEYKKDPLTLKPPTNELQ